MARVLVLANLELSFDVPDGVEIDSDEFARLKERRMLRVLETLAREHPQIKGSLERLEYESFTYDSHLGGEPKGYYYNKTSKVEEL